MFNIDLTFLWTAVNLALMYFFIKKFLFKWLAVKMDARSAAIAAGLSKGEELTRETALFNRQREEWKRDIAVSRQNLMDETKAAAKREAESILREAEREAARIKEEAKVRAEQEILSIRQELTRETITLALAAASGVLEENMDDKRNRALAEKFISERKAS